MFESTEAKKIAAMMTMVSSIEEVDPAMEMSALQELANILIGAFLTSISDFVGLGFFQQHLKPWWILLTLLLITF